MYVLGIHRYAQWRRLSHQVAVLSHAAPSLVAVSIGSLYLLMRYDLGMLLAAIWTLLWLLLMFVTSAAGLAQVIWTVVALTKRKRTAWAPISVLGTVMCAFSWVTLAAHMPTA